MGEAKIDGGSTPWAFVLKIFSLGGAGFEAASADPHSWDYWKREWLVYQSPLLDRLDGRLQGPRCFGTGESRDGYAWIAMEDLTAADDRPWPLSRFGTVARHVGEFNGSYLAGTPLPADDYLGSGWLRGWTERAEPMIALLPTMADHPLLARMYPPAVTEELLRLWRNRDALYDALDALPQTFCHQDIFPRNVFVVAGKQGEYSVVIDWAFSGLGPVGQDLAALVVASLAFFEADQACADELEARCLQGYLSGLEDSGWHESAENVEFGYLASAVLRYGVGGIGPLLTLTLNESMHGLVEEGFGRPLSDVVENVRATMPFLQKRIGRMQRMLASR
jgi:hypothetical protein